MSKNNNTGRGKTYKAHVSQAKTQTVEQFVELLNHYDVIAAVNMENLPARQLQTMKENMRDNVKIIMTKRLLIEKAIDQCDKKNIQDIKAYLKGMPALMFSKQDPFTLYSTIKKRKSKAPIKAGQTAPNDIVVSAGKTSFSPGPIIGELGAFKIKTGIEDGKVAIKSDTVVAKEGQVVEAKLAGILQRLGIQPMEIGLDITAVYENGEILRKDVLNIDEQEYLDNLAGAHKGAIALALEIGYATKETISIMITKAHREAFTLATDADILTDATVGIVFSKAEAQAAEIRKLVQD